MQLQDVDLTASVPIGDAMSIGVCIIKILVRLLVASSVAVHKAFSVSYHQVCQTICSSELCQRMKASLCTFSWEWNSILQHNQ